MTLTRCESILKSATEILDAGTSVERVAVVRKQVDITEKQAAELARLAAEEGTSRAEIVRRSLDLYLRTRASRHQEQRERALKAVGRFRSGRRDLAERHDKYLAEALLP